MNPYLKEIFMKILGGICVVIGAAALIWLAVLISLWR